MNINTFIKQNYIILDSNEIFEIHDLKELADFFKGYNKVIFSILMNHLGLQHWKTLIFKDLTEENKKVLNKFVKKGRNYFLRTDTYNEYISNVSYSGPGEHVFERVDEFKKIEKRYIVLLEIPDVINQEYKNIASGRSGIINGEELQEWVGPGFSEYHLAKDRFPDKCTMHSVVRIKSNKIEYLWNVSKEKYAKDLNDLFMGIAARELNLKKTLFDREFYKKVTGNEIVGVQATQDEIWFAYEKWKEKLSEQLDIKPDKVNHIMEGYGFQHLINLGKGESAAIDFVVSGEPTWKPSKQQIQMVHKHFKIFEKRLKKLGINPEEKLITYTINEKAHHSGIIFWDIHNLNL